MNDQPADKELMELDEWIALNLFSKHRFETHPINCVCVCNKEYWDDIHCWPTYSTDPADAMQVLNSCLEKGGWVALSKCEPGRYAASNTVSPSRDDDAPINISAWGGTPEETICRFARQLFSKESK